MNEDITNIRGEVIESLPNTMFRVKLADGRVVIATLKGSLRKSYVRIFPGDTVLIAMTKYDTDRGRIVQKFNNKGR